MRPTVKSLIKSSVAIHQNRLAIRELNSKVKGSRSNNDSKSRKVERVKVERLQGESRVSRIRSSVSKSGHPCFLVINPSDYVAIVAAMPVVCTFCALVLECNDLLPR